MYISLATLGYTMKIDDLQSVAYFRFLDGAHEARLPFFQAPLVSFYLFYMHIQVYSIVASLLNKVKTR